MKFRDLPFRDKIIMVWAVSFAVWTPWWLIGYYDCLGRIRQGAMGISPFFSYLNFPFRLVAAVYILTSLWGIFFRRKREKAVLYLGAGLIYFFCQWLSGAEGWARDRAALLDCAERSRPLISAIEAYSADNGAPPKTLEDLIPRYLSSIPPTGLGPINYFHKPRRFEYDSDENFAWRRAGNPWALDLPIMDGGFVPEDCSFVYLPSRNYSDLRNSLPARLTVPIGGWAYQKYGLTG